MKQDVLANASVPELDIAVVRACASIMALSPRERLGKADVLSNRFWLRKVLQKIIWAEHLVRCSRPSERQTVLPTLDGCSTDVPTEHSANTTHLCPNR